MLSDQHWLLIQVSFLVVIVILFRKTIADVFLFIAGIFTQKRKNIDERNLEMLIEEKKSELRAGNIGSEWPHSTDPLKQRPKRETETKGNAKQFSSLAEEAYTTAYEEAKAKKDESKSKEILQILKLFDEAQWGSGASFKKISADFKDKNCIELTADDFSKEFIYLIKNNLLFRNSSKNIARLKQIENGITCRALLTKMVKETPLSSNFWGGLSELLEIDKEILYHGFLYLLLENMKEAPESIYKIIFNHHFKLASINESEICELINHIITHNYEKDFFISPPVLLKNLSEKAVLMNCLKPLPNLDSSKDVDGAYRVFGLTPNAKFEDVHVAYKKLASIKHPDRITGKQLPEFLVNIATNNFAILQQAYQLIKEHSH